ncbi:hypothetical protein NX784_26590 [Massilia pinisoli]|uniref:Lipoprotein n=1 Tax=Massilia pinisoli TaxID=1772194 RepID=A0ABT1ZZ05_9BURK|nr:hypothetical protein [Massilia pinisoli]MCS0585161.1 hypothetical protein [Massilia pinisoli]
MKSKHTFAAIGCLFVLSACGGGGGGGGGDVGSAAASTPAPAAAPTITAIASIDASKAAENSFSASHLVSAWPSAVPDMLNGVSIAPVDAGLIAPVFDLLKRAYSQQDASLLTGVTRSYSCTEGGSIAVEATQHDPLTPTAGDTWKFTSTNCGASGTIQNGTISAKVTDAAGNLFQSTSGAMTLDVAFGNYSSLQGGVTTVVDGGMKVSVSKMGLNSSTFTTTGTSLQQTIQQSGTTIATRTLSSFSVTGSKEGSLLTSAANFSLSGHSNRLGQFAYTVRNLTPFTTTATVTPTSGALVVSGAGSSVTMTVSPDSVRLDHSDNANGTITSTVTRTWNDFLGDY